MIIKKYLFFVLLLFALNFTYQPGNVTYLREKHSISNTVNTNHDRYTEDFISQSEKTRFYIYISLAAKIIYLDNNVPFNNTS